MRTCLAVQTLLYLAKLGAAAAAVGALGLAMKDGDNASPNYCPLTLRSSKPTDWPKDNDPHICNYTLFSAIASLSFALLLCIIEFLRCYYSWQR
jgi:hypothetical protein